MNHSSKCLCLACTVCVTLCPLVSSDMWLQLNCLWELLPLGSWPQFWTIKVQSPLPTVLGNWYAFLGNWYVGVGSASGVHLTPFGVHPSDVHLNPDGKCQFSMPLRVWVNGLAILAADGICVSTSPESWWHPATLWPVLTAYDILVWSVSWAKAVRDPCVALQKAAFSWLQSWYPAANVWNEPRISVITIGSVCDPKSV